MTTGRWPFKKSFTLFLACTAPLYLYAIYSILMHTAQKNISAAYASPEYSQHPAAVVGLLAAVGYGWVLKWWVERGRRCNK